MQARLLPALLVAALVLVQALGYPAAAQEVQLKFYPEDVKGDYFEVGFSVSLTGGLEEFGGEALCALKATVDWINDRGGVFVKGIRHSVRLVYADDGSSPEKALEVYQALYDRGVNLLLSPAEPVLAQAVARNFIAAGDVNALLVNYALGSEVMIVGARDKIVGATGTLTTYIVDTFKIINGLEPAARILVVHARPQVYVSAVNEAVKQAQEAKIGVIVEDTVSLSRDTLQADVNRVVDTVNQVKPDMIVIVADDELAGEAVKALYGKIPVKLVVAVGISSPRIFGLTAGATQSQDVLVVTDWLADGALPPEEATALGLPFTGPTFEVFKQYLKERCPAIQPGAIAARAAAALILLANSVQKANSFDPAKIREAAVNYGIATFYGPIVIDEATSLSKMPPAMVGQWDAGKLVYLGHLAHEGYQHVQGHEELDIAKIRYPSKQWREALEQGATGVPQQQTQETQQQGQQEAEAGGGTGMLLAAAAVVVLIAVAAAAVALRRRG